nr:hypothetical protein [Tanacetum cinerariifolium]
FECIRYGARVLSQKRSEVGRGVKEMQHSSADKSAEVGNRVNKALDGNRVHVGSDPAANAGLESFPIVFKAHEIHPPASVNEENMNDVVNFHTLLTPGGNGIDVVVPVEFIRAKSERFANTAFSFFLGKRVANPVVVDYGLNAMLENGMWFIRNNPLILKKWHPDVNLLKEDVATVLVWVKLHSVPITVFSEDGLSVIAIKLGTPLMLDSYTSSYARAMIEHQADVELKDNNVAAMSKITKEGYYTCNIRVEYE